MKKRVKESDFEFRVAEIPLGEFNCQTIHHAYKGECNPWVWHAMGQGQKGTLEQMAEVVMAEVADVVYVSEEQIIPKSINEYIHKFQKSSMTNAQPPVLDVFEKRTLQDGVLSQWFNDEAVSDTEDPLLFFTAEQSGLEGPSAGLSQSIKNPTNPKERPLNHEFITQITENTLVPKCVEMQAQVRLTHRI